MGLELWNNYSEIKPEKGKDIEYIDTNGRKGFVFLCNCCGNEWRCSVTGGEGRKRQQNVHWAKHSWHHYQTVNIGGNNYELQRHRSSESVQRAYNGKRRSVG